MIGGAAGAARRAEHGSERHDAGRGKGVVDVLERPARADAQVVEERVDQRVPQQGRRDAACGAAAQRAERDAKRAVSDADQQPGGHGVAHDTRRGEGRGGPVGRTAHVPPDQEAREGGQGEAQHDADRAGRHDGQRLAGERARLGPCSRDADRAPPPVPAGDDRAEHDERRGEEQLVDGLDVELARQQALQVLGRRAELGIHRRGETEIVHETEHVRGHQGQQRHGQHQRPGHPGLAQHEQFGSERGEHTPSEPRPARARPGACGARPADAANRPRRCARRSAPGRRHAAAVARSGPRSPPGPPRPGAG